MAESHGMNSSAQASSSVRLPDGSGHRAKDVTLVKKMVKESDMSRDWPALFDNYGVQFIILDLQSDRDLVETIQSQTGWVVDFQDEEAVIFARAT